MQRSLDEGARIAPQRLGFLDQNGIASSSEEVT